MINNGKLEIVIDSKVKLKSLLGIYHKWRCFNRISLIGVVELEINSITDIKKKWIGSYK